VYSALQQADTIGMFQIESRAQMSCLPRLRPQRFYDIVVQVAIIRPGPIVGQMVNPYLQRRQGRAPVVYAHPSLEPVLARTLGVPLFQEQLLRMAMVVAGFTGGEAEELRRAMGFKRSQARMKEIEARLRTGMTRNGIAREAQEEIILAISSFALYGFPESHAASFALIAYASAYLKCHYLAAFTAALLNNQPMGFYRPATIVKDAQRHGLKIFPIDVMRSEWSCTLEPVANPVVGRSSLVVGQNANGHDSDWFCTLKPVASSRFSVPSLGPALRIGLRYARGLREEAAQALVRQRNLARFTSIRDLVHRVPELRKDELNTLAEIGALNSIGSAGPSTTLRASSPAVVGAPSPPLTAHSVLGTRNSQLHRRDALWQVERAVRHSGPLLDKLPEPDAKSPLRPMNEEERLVADFRGTGLTVGPHPMAYHRQWMNSLGIRRAVELRNIPNGQHVRIGGGVIARQRPGTAKGFVFLSLEDETGVANAIVTPDLFQKNRLLLTSEQFLMVEGILQNQDNVISVKAECVRPLSITRAQTTSHDFY
jgi:error-prone DNA polymerase